MWKLYDDLYIGIPSGIRITGCDVGKHWTTVRIDGNVGIARTLEQPKDPLGFAAGFVGRYLRDVAGHLYWDDLPFASVGVAAMNAWYNTADRVEGLEGARMPENLTGTTAYVGHYDCGDVFSLPMRHDFECKEYQRLADFDNVVIASEALITRALPKLLDIIGEDGNAVLEGYSLPSTALFFAFGMPVRELRGYYPKVISAAEACALLDTDDSVAGMSKFCIRPI
jgi:uncharacterized protein (DUF4213/DUF364 family)